MKDTVQPYNEFEGTGTGFSFANYNAHDMLHVIKYALDVFENHKDRWQENTYDEDEMDEIAEHMADLGFSI